MKPKKLLLMFQSRNFLLLFFLLLLSVACSNRDDATTPEQQLPRDGTPSFGSVNFSKGLEVIGDPSGNQNYIEIEASNFKEGKPILQFICNL